MRFESIVRMGVVGLCPPTWRVTRGMMFLGYAAGFESAGCGR